jgi:hypothetical protein
MASITSLRVAAYPNGRPAALDLIGTWQFGS